MTANGDLRDDDDPVMEWSLGERLGGEQPPDLVDAVRARLKEAPVAQPAPQRSTSQLVAAALVLLGVAVVCGVALWPKGDDVLVAPQEPKPVHVDTLTNIAVLPPDTRAIEVSGVHDVQFAELARLHDLEVLIVREPWNESFGLSLKMSRPREAYHVSASSLGVIAGFTKLHRLELSGVVGVALFAQYPRGSEGGARVVEAFATLERLPLLESLTLRCLDTEDELLAVLPRLRNLRHLDLSFNHGFGEDGVRAIAQCSTLRKLSLRGCQQLHGDVLAQLAALPELEHLDLSAIDGINWRAGSAELDDAQSVALRERARRMADRLGMGPNDTTLQALAGMPKLRVLNISGSHHFTGKGLAALGRCTTLRGLDASGLRDGGGEWVRSLPQQLESLEVGGEHDDAFCIAVAEHLTNMRDLTLAACDRITDAGVRAVAKMPSLRRLDLRQMRGLTAATIDTLAAATQLEALDLRHDDFVTAEHVLRLRRSLPRLQQLETSVPEHDLKDAAKPVAFTHVRTKTDIEALPLDTRGVIGMHLDDAALAALDRLRSLEELELVAVEAMRLSDAGMKHVAQHTSLRRLTLRGPIRLTAAALRELQQLPGLEELHLQVDVPDDVLAGLVGLQLRSLLVNGCPPGRAGIEAIVQMPRLRELTLGDVRGLDASTLVLLRAARGLERLRLAAADPGWWQWWMGVTGPVTAEAHGPVTDDVLAALARLPLLAELGVPGAALTAAGLRALHGAPKLERLDLSATTLRAADLRELPPGLTSLVLRGCRELGAGFGSEIAAAVPGLRHLALQRDADADVHLLRELYPLRSLRELELSWIGALPVEGIHDLRAMPWLESLELYTEQKVVGDPWQALLELPLRRLVPKRLFRIGR